MSQVAVKWTGEDSHMFVGRDSRGATIVLGGWYKKGDESWTDWRGPRRRTCWWLPCSRAPATTCGYLAQAARIGR